MQFDSRSQASQGRQSRRGEQVHHQNRARVNRQRASISALEYCELRLLINSENGVAASSVLVFSFAQEIFVPFLGFFVIRSMCWFVWRVCRS
jgi:hypothetical protein